MYPLTTLRLLFVFCFTLASSSSFSSSSGDVQQRTIPWSNIPNPSAQDLFLLNVTVNKHIMVAPADTGSTGFLISAADLDFADPTPLKNCCEPAFQYLSSSRRYYEGYWLPSNLTFTSLAGTPIEATVPVLAVTERGNCSAYVDGKCTKDQIVSMPTGTRYMGIGFGRWSDEQPGSTAARNPLLNFDFGNNQELGSGYIISDQGIVVGISAQDLAAGWHLTNLTENTDPGAPKDRPEWRGTPMCVEVAGSDCFPGTALFDTGIDYSFLGVPSKATENVKTKQGSSYVLKDGTEVTVRVGQTGKPGFDFSFEVGDFSAQPAVAPKRVRLTKEHSDGAFINTGRYFYNGFELLFDEVDGVVGLRRKAGTGAVNKTRTYSSNEL